MFLLQGDDIFFFNFTTYITKCAVPLRIPIAYLIPEEKKKVYITQQ